MRTKSTLNSLGDVWRTLKVSSPPELTEEMGQFILEASRETERRYGLEYMTWYRALLLEQLRIILDDPEQSRFLV